MHLGGPMPSETQRASNQTGMGFGPSEPGSHKFHLTAKQLEHWPGANRLHTPAERELWLHQQHRASLGGGGTAPRTSTSHIGSGQRQVQHQFWKHGAQRQRQAQQPGRGFMPGRPSSLGDIHQSTLGTRDMKSYQPPPHAKGAFMPGRPSSLKDIQRETKQGFRDPGHRSIDPEQLARLHREAGPYSGTTGTGYSGGGGMQQPGSGGIKSGTATPGMSGVPQAPCL